MTKNLSADSRVLSDIMNAARGRHCVTVDGGGRKAFGKEQPMARWSGWWEQRGYGRQEMRNLVLNVGPDGSLSGSGEDCVGKFTFAVRQGAGHHR
jgi:hypothetical protein